MTEAISSVVNIALSGKPLPSAFAVVIISGAQLAPQYEGKAKELLGLAAKHGLMMLNAGADVIDIIRLIDCHQFIHNPLITLFYTFKYFRCIN